MDRVIDMIILYGSSTGAIMHVSDKQNTESSLEEHSINIPLTRWEGLIDEDSTINNRRMCRDIRATLGKINNQAQRKWYIKDNVLQELDGGQEFHV